MMCNVFECLIGVLANVMIIEKMFLWNTEQSFQYWSSYLFDTEKKEDYTWKWAYWDLFNNVL